MWQPWYRRRGPLTTLAGSALALLVLVGIGVWLAVVAPAPTHRHPGDLNRFLVDTPVNTEPMSPDAFSQRTDPADTAGVDVVAEAWSGPRNGDQGEISLLRFASADTAYRVSSGFARAEARILSDSLPGIPGALMYSQPDELLVVGAQGDVVFVIIERGPDAARDDIAALAQAQYDRL